MTGGSKRADGAQDERVWQNARMRILLVEDDNDLVEVLVPALREGGFEVERSADGAEGLDRALTHELDAIVLD
ncbi:MAG: hypothetical protein ACRD3J_30290, partial [Thermoanaerobaculia bacterium]